MTRDPQTRPSSDAVPPCRRYELIPAAVFLFILPFTHTVALRLLCLAVASLTALYCASRRPRPSLPLRLPLLFWAGIALLSVIWSIEPSYSVGEFRNEVGYAMLAFLAFFYLTESESEWRFWQLTLTLSAVVIALFAVYYYTHYHTWITTERIGDRNAYSTYIVLIMPLLLLAAVRSKGLTRIFVLASIPLALITGYLTLNRIMWAAMTAEFAIFGSLVFLKALLPPRKRLAGILGLVASCVLLSTAFVLSSYEKSGGAAESVEAMKHYTEQDPRVEIWLYATKQIAQRPLTGYGFGRGILRHQFTQHFNTALHWHAHNMLLNYALEAGIFGVLGLLGLFFAMVWTFWKLFKTECADVWPIGVFGLTLLAGLAIKTATDDILVRDNALLFWSLIGMALGLAQHRLRVNSGEAACSVNGAA